MTLQLSALMSIVGLSIPKQTIWGCGLLGSLPGISPNGTTTGDMTVLINSLKQSSTTGKLTYWNWGLLPTAGQYLSKDFEFIPEQWWMETVNSSEVIPAGKSNFRISNNKTSPATMSTLFLGANEPDIIGSCLGNLMGKCNSSCLTSEVDNHMCPVALLNGPPADALPNGHCDCQSQSEASGSGFWGINGCKNPQPLPKLFEDPSCVDIVMRSWRKQAAIIVKKGYKYLSTPLIANSMTWLINFMDAACSNCSSVSCGCPSHVSWHFYSSDCRPIELGGYNDFQSKLNITRQLMERYPHLQGAVINEVGMLNCVISTSRSSCIPNSPNQKYPAINQTNHQCPKTKELPEGLGSFIDTLIDMIIPVRTNDGRRVVAGLSWFNENMSGGTYNLELFTNGTLNAVGRHYVKACLTSDGCIDSTCAEQTNATVREAGQAPPENPPNRIFIARHGERMDHINPAWSLNAARGHDSPLSPTGKTQAKELGDYLKARLQSNDMVVYSSPLVRAVQTARHAIRGMQLTQDPVLSIESCFAETETSVHKKMMLAEKKPDIHQGLCKPVLLSPADLMSVFSNINLDYSDVANINYDDEGWEIDPNSSEPQTMKSRVHSCISKVLSQPRNANKDVVIFAHDGVTKAVIKSLTGSDVPKVRYTEVYELHPQESDWSLESSWVPPSLQRK